MFLVRKRLPAAFVYLYMHCLFLVVLLLLLLCVKLLSAEFAAVRELSDEKFNGPRVSDNDRGLCMVGSDPVGSGLVEFSY